jgi:hypothetical protein
VEVPEGDLVWLLERDEESMLRAADEACLDAVQELDGHPPLGLLAFDCELRGLLLGDEGTRREVARMTTHVGQVPVAGLYTWGEIARLNAGNGYHNWMLVVLAIG